MIKFSSFYNIGHEEAFNTIQSGILGQSDKLEKLGINMSGANLEAFALAQGLNKSYSEMSEAEKATLRYNYMLQETSNIQGDFAKNSGSFANQMSIAKLNMQELSTGVGKILLPIAEDAMKKFNELGEKLKEALKLEEVQSSMVSIADGISKLIENVGELALDILPIFLDLLKWIIDNSGIISAAIVGIGTALATLKVANMINNIIEKFKGAEKATKLWEAAQKLLNIQLALSPFVLITTAIIALVAVIIYLWNTNEGFREVVINCWNAIKDTALGVWDWLVNLFTVDIPNAWNTLLEFFQGIPDWFAQLWDSVINTFLSWGENIGQFFSETIPMWINNIIEWFNQLPYNIGFALGTVLGNIIQWVLDTWTYLVENIPLWIQGISYWFAQLPGAIGQWLINVLLNIYQWGSDVYNNAITWISNTINNIINWFASLPGNIAICLSSCISNIVSWGYNMITSGINAASGLVSNIVSIISGLPGQIYNIGINIVQGLWNGILSMGSWIKDKVSGFFSGIVDGIKSVLGIHSPSRVFRDDVGKYMAQGVGVGFTDESESIESEMSGALVNLTSKMRATVEFETAKTSLGMMNSFTSVSTNEATSEANDSGVFIIKNYMDSDEISEYTYRKVDTKFALAGKKVR